MRLLKGSPIHEDITSPGHHAVIAHQKVGDRLCRTEHGQRARYLLCSNIIGQSDMMSFHRRNIPRYFGVGVIIVENSISERPKFGTQGTESGLVLPVASSGQAFGVKVRITLGNQFGMIQH